MEICRGTPRDPEQGFVKTCPIRHRCWRYNQFLNKTPPAGATTIDGPYDFDDKECGKYMEP